MILTFVHCRNENGDFEINFEYEFEQVPSRGDFVLVKTESGETVWAEVILSAFYAFDNLETDGLKAEVFAVIRDYEKDVQSKFLE
jgi:hypothetical protein